MSIIGIVMLIKINILLNIKVDDQTYPLFLGEPIIFWSAVNMVDNAEKYIN